MIRKLSDSKRNTLDIEGQVTMKRKWTKNETYTVYFSIQNLVKIETDFFFKASKSNNLETNSPFFVLSSAQNFRVDNYDNFKV